MNKKPKVLIIVSSFPKPPNLMNLSIWALEQTKEIAELANCTVVSPTPKMHIPNFLNRFLPSKLKKWSNIEIKHDFGNFVALYPCVPVRTYTRKSRFNYSNMVAMKNINEIIASNADTFACPSKHVLDSITAKYHVNNPIVVYNGGADPIGEPRKFDFSSGKVKFVSVGALYEYKN